MCVNLEINLNLEKIVIKPLLLNIISNFDWKLQLVPFHWFCYEITEISIIVFVDIYRCNYTCIECMKF